MSPRQAPGAATVTVRNVGGIDETEVALEPGVNVLAGRNATNRTSLLRAVMGALGSDRVSLKADADEGRVDLRLGDETYTRTLRRGGDGVALGGDPYLDDPTAADLFAFLLESSDARRAVERGDDLREVVMRPIDTDAIRAEIDRLAREKRRVDDELDRLDDAERRRRDLQERRDDLDAEIEDVRARLDAKRDDLDGADLDVARTRAERDRLEASLDALEDARSELRRVRSRLDAERESLDALVDERDGVESDLDGLDDPGDVDDLDRELARLRERKDDLDAEITDLGSVVEFNRDLLDDAGAVGDAVQDDGDDGAVTDRLVADDRTVCWTCGSEVEADRIRETVSHLDAYRREKVAERRDVADRLDEVAAERDRRREQRRERDRLESRLDAVTDEIADRRATVADLEDERDRLRDAVARLEADVDALEDSAYSDLLDCHQAVNRLEFELDDLEDERAEVEAALRRVERDLDARGRLRDERERVQARLTDLRTRIDRVEADAVEAFNDHVATLLDVLDYDNLDRVWLERTGGDAPGDRRFDLHVVRTTDDGAAYEDAVDHLSESEREVVGLVFALAGYLVHDLHETVPFVLLDSLEAIDAERIGALVDYFADHAPHLVVALLPEDAAALDDDHRRVTDG